MSKCSPEKEKEQYCNFNSALRKREYVQPWNQYYSKMAASICVLITMVRTIFREIELTVMVLV